MENKRILLQFQFHFVLLYFDLYFCFNARTENYFIYSFVNLFKMLKEGIPHSFDFTRND